MRKSLGIQFCIIILEGTDSVMHLFKSQDEQNTPEYNGQESDVFVNTKRAGD